MICVADNMMLVCKSFRMHKEFILLSALVAVVCGKSVPLLKPLSQEMIDFINNEAQTTWKVCMWALHVSFYIDYSIWWILRCFAHYQPISLRSVIMCMLQAAWMYCPAENLHNCEGPQCKSGWFTMWPQHKWTSHSINDIVWEWLNWENVEDRCSLLGPDGTLVFLADCLKFLPFGAFECFCYEIATSESTWHRHMNSLFHDSASTRTHASDFHEVEDGAHNWLETTVLVEWTSELVCIIWHKF